LAGDSASYLAPFQYPRLVPCKIAKFLIAIRLKDELV
jgi:hypothetical protein